MDWTNIIHSDHALLLRLNGSDSMLLDSIMLSWTSGFTWIPLYMALMFVVVKNNKSIRLISITVSAAALSVITSAFITNVIVKPHFHRLRPFNDPQLFGLLDLVGTYNENSFSFFSAHAANTFSLALFMSLLIRSRVITAIMIVWALINCYTRLYLAFHFPTDILCGIICGCVVALIYYWIYCRIAYGRIDELNFVSNKYTKTGYALTDIDMVAIVFVVTVLVIIFKALFSVYFL